MEFTRQLGVAVILVTGTLWLQSAEWPSSSLARTFIARGIRGLGPWMSVVPDPLHDGDGCPGTFCKLCCGQGLIAGCFFPSLESAFYFSASSYSTVGYGDIVLPKVWRILGPIESVIGVLMCAYR